MKIHSALIALISLAILAAQPTYARQQPASPNHVDWQKQLDLSSVQMGQIKKIKEGGREDMQKMRSQKWALYKKMVMMSHGKEISQNKLDSLISEMNALSEKMMRQEIKTKHDIYTVLTPEQRAKLDSITQKQLQKMEKIYGQ